MCKPDPYHIHPRHKRTAYRLYKPLFLPLTPLKAGTRRARKAETYRANGRTPQKPRNSIYIGFVPTGKYSGAKLRDIRAEKGVGRPSWRTR